MYLHELVAEDPRIAQRALKDPRWIIEKMFWIVDKGGQKVPFKFKPQQNKWYDMVFLKRNKPAKSADARIDILKARKQGFSSMILAIWTVFFLFKDNAWCVCISHEDESTQRLFSKVEYYLNNLRIGDTPISVELDTKSRKRIKYKHVNSEFYIGTAGSMNFGRGDTIHYLHGSEVAFWKDVSVVLTGALNAVPDDFENTMVIKESTANGMGTQHHLEWVNEETGHSAFRPVFFGWHEDPEYTMEPPKDFAMTTDEKILAARYGLSDGQIAWRRWKISSMQPSEKYTKEELFMQEYPISPQEAFISSGKPIFSRSTLDFYKDTFVQKPKLVGELLGWDPPFFTENPAERLLVWEEPVVGRDYLVAADVAEKGDACYAMVVDRKTFRQVAAWDGVVDEFEFAGILFKIGMWYNEAYMAPERNNQGVAVVKKLDELGYRNMYQRETIDEITQKVHNDLGWRTDAKTRPIMIADFNQDVTQRKFVIRDEKVILQMESFVRNDRGRPEAAAGAKDDAVIAACIAGQIYKMMPEPIETQDIMVRGYRPNDSLHNFSHK